jgi:hypothetical protein
MSAAARSVLLISIHDCDFFGGCGGGAMLGLTGSTTGGGLGAGLSGLAVA